MEEVPATDTERQREGDRETEAHKQVRVHYYCKKCFPCPGMVRMERGKHVLSESTQNKKVIFNCNCFFTNIKRNPPILVQSKIGKCF